MVTILDGKKIAREIREEVAQTVFQLKTQGITPQLSVVLVGEDPASQVYVHMKEKACGEVGIDSKTWLLPDQTAESELIDLIKRLNADPEVHGILVQFPLPKSIQGERIIETIDPEKDVDGFHPMNVGKLAAGFKTDYLPCTPAGIHELLIRYGYSPEGRHVVILGRSNIVGKPLALILMQKAPGANATVTVCHASTRDLPEITRTADILVAAIGKPEFVRADMVRNEAIVIDVGVNRIPDPKSPKGYRIVGDVAFEEVSRRAEAITPVPGGVGPMTIAMLLKNTIAACRKLTFREP